MIVAKSGNYVLQHETFLGTRKLTTFALEICKKVDGSYYTICKIDRETRNLHSISNRLVESVDTLEDIESLKILTRILYNIYDTEELELE